jgi:DNA helicase II / ATP-dependent DNA helicase PcrA
VNASLAVRAPRAFVASVMQERFFDWVENGSGSAILKAVAGSGKSTSVVRAMARVPESATAIILAFNASAAKDLKAKIEALAAEIGRPLRNVEAATFHSRGFRALTRRFGRDVKVEVDGGKVRKILKDRLSERELEMYGDFVCKLVSFAKGVGIGIPGLTRDDRSAWKGIVDSQDMWLDDEEATEERGIEIARKALAASNAKAEKERWIDFDDQLYLPLLWNLRLYGHDWVVVDEAQDTNPVRRAFARKLLKPGGRFVAVGDPKQAIYGFTGASADAMDLIAAEFKTVELPLTVSYRCPRAVGELARSLVPYFEVAPGAIEGSVEHVKESEALKRFGPGDAILCRQTAPLISLAFRLIAEGRGVFVLGRDVGAGLANLIKKLNARGVDVLLERLDGWLAKELEKAKKEENPRKAEAAEDRVAAIKAIADAMPERDRTVPGLLAKIDELFRDGVAEDLITLATEHKSKGREWKRVGILKPELSPSKAAKTDAAYEQELNLMYVAFTRAIEELIFIITEVR